jgi:1-acyl-sn-glycerol-3-phosphate acyltransferase
MKKLPRKMNGKGGFYTFALTHIICRIACFLWLKNWSKAFKSDQSRDCYIVASNHQSFLDFMLLIFYFRNDFPTFFIHKDHYYSIFNFFLKNLEQIPAVKGSIQKAEAVLRERLPLFIFPEGKRTNGGIGRFHSGVAVLAKKFPSIPVIPVGIKGAVDIWPHKAVLPSFFAGRKIRVSIGKKMRFSAFNSKKEFLTALKEEIKQLSSS